jgi:hypothetical protein
MTSIISSILGRYHVFHCHPGNFLGCRDEWGGRLKMRLIASAEGQAEGQADVVWV